jgi:hypothetical protein
MKPGADEKRWAQRLEETADQDSDPHPAGSSETQGYSWYSQTACADLCRKAGAVVRVTLFPFHYSRPPRSRSSATGNAITRHRRSARHSTGQKDIGTRRQTCMR